jgi:murein DD-endopeptidase MepM/ murein hydrolase activator NlpD
MNLIPLFTSQHNFEVTHVIDLPYKDYISIDLSGSNKDLELFDISKSSEWEIYLDSYLKKNGKKVAYGGYMERRALYDRSNYFNTKDKSKQRCIHLGLDLWVDAGTAVLAAFDGKVHSFKNNINFGDYGPTIILEHQIDNVTFYTLYGHLSLNSIENISIGDTFNKGETIAVLGDATINGDYAPHLHFQIINDLQGNDGDYPGVSSLENLSFYKSNCPDPKLVLGLN